VRAQIRSGTYTLAVSGSVKHLRRLAVVVFTDMVDSTAQRGRLGDQRADEVRVAVDALHADLIAANGGQIVKHLGDGMMAAFPSAAAALFFAAGFQSELRRLSARFPEPVAFRVGIAAGDVVEDRNDLFGMSVVHAARLCAACQGGEVLVADLVRELGGSDPGVELHDPRQLDLKGIDAPVTAWLLNWESNDVEAELPVGLHRDRRFKFVGRSREWEALVGAWRRSLTGEAQVALVSGEAGVGKTRLVAELAAWVSDEGGTVLFGRNDEELVVPYQPFAEALRHYVVGQPDWSVARRLGPMRAELVRLLPELSSLVEGLQPPPVTDPDTERHRLFESVVRWLEELSTEGPVLLVIDDLHWASAPTRQMLRHLASSNAPLSVLIVGTYRDTDPDTPAGLASLPASPRRIHHVPVRAFDEHTVLDFLEAAAGHSLDEMGPPLARLIHSHSGGNAFFCRELALHLVDTGVLTQVDGRWSSTISIDTVGVPESIRRVIDDRLGRVPELARDTLKWAAVLGQQVDVKLLTSVVDASDDEVMRALDQCVAARLLEETGLDQFHFSHALVRSALTDSITESRRRRMHRRIAEQMLGLREAGGSVHVGELARHFELGADESQRMQAVSFCREAGEQAMEQLAYEEAVDFYERALALFDRAVPVGERAVERCDLAALLAAAAIRAADPRVHELSNAAIAAADASGDPFRVGHALLVTSRRGASVSGAVDRERVDRLEAALEDLPTADDPLRARLLAVLASELTYTGEVGRVIEIGDQALAMARRVGDRATRVFVLVERLAAIRMPEQLDAQLSDVVELARLSRLEGDTQAEFFAAYRAAEIHLSLTDLDGFLAAVETAGGLAAEPGQRALQIRALRISEEAAWLRGDLDAASSDLERFWSLAGASNLQGQYTASYLGSASKLAAARGDHPFGVEAYRKLASLPRGIEGFRAGLAVSLIEAGEVDEAREIYERLLAGGVDQLARNPIIVHTLTFIASLCASLGDAERAPEIERSLEPYRDLWVVGGSNSYGPVWYFVARLLALQGRHDDADAAFAEAARRCEAMQAPLLGAWNDISWAEALACRGLGESARSLLERAAAVATEHRAPGVERAALLALERLDIETPSPF
jgi:class 3 adenylate cyclase/tetratricopeptide (TPR) repeat protein